ncbi:tRNA (32-2'-O)-methyltransferase regulator THADA-like isoform X3 [Acropora muricata]|uniref:tRNA (32-2'-O)-methyltransferase regulator THADA-like isoform X3 n=1 Tax=Acropora muricata TaxID=159855 RepID=UPI0034E3EF34
MKKQKKVYTQKLVVSEASTRELQAMTMYESGNLAEVSQLLNQCLQEDDSIKQCTLLKKAGALLQGPNWKSGEVFSSDLGKCLTFLAEVFVICDIKNPSRKVIASTFDNLPVHWCSDVFSNVFLDKLKEVSKEILELVSIRIWLNTKATVIVKNLKILFRHKSQAIQSRKRSLTSEL